MQLKDTQKIVTRYKSDFVCYNHDIIISDSLRLYGEYQQIELDFLLQFAKDRVVYDVGSNIGTHALGFASVARQVYGFEASPKHFQLLKENTKHSKNIKVSNHAVSDIKGKIFIESFDTGRPGNYGSIRLSDKGKSVNTIKLDDLDIEPPDLIKIDVEGHEWSVLNGAQQIITRHRPLIYFEAQELPSIGAIYPLLDALGYDMVWCAIPNFNPNNFNANPLNIFSNSGIFSVFCAQRGQLDLSGFKKVLGVDDSWEKVNSR